MDTIPSQNPTSNAHFVHSSPKLPHTPLLIGCTVPEEEEDEVNS